MRDTLQTETDPLIFAAGDCASMIERPLEKAGVFAVRMGKPLAENLRRTLLRQPLIAYRPQRRWLALISTGDRHAIASRGAFYARGDLGLALEGLDRPPLHAQVQRASDTMPRTRRSRQAKRFRSTKPSRPRRSPPSPCAAAAAAPRWARRCCRARWPASSPIERDDVLIGLHAPDDAAVVRVPPGKAMVHTVDFFRAFIDDPWLFGRIAANHALGDIFAMGAEAQSATAIATVPPGLESKVEDTVFQMMSGAVSVLNEAGCALVGGHTGEGKELALGFAINGLIDETARQRDAQGRHAPRRRADPRPSRSAPAPCSPPMPGSRRAAAGSMPRSSRCRSRIAPPCPA